MNNEELKIIIEQHELWLISNREKGSRANLSGADLSGADLLGAKLLGADLSGAKLSGANLSRANLLGANLANIKGIKIFSAYLGQHQILIIEDEVQIGCQRQKLDYWLENGEKLGKENGYSDEEIKDYLCFIKQYSRK